MNSGYVTANLLPSNDNLIKVNNEIDNSEKFEEILQSDKE